MTAAATSSVIMMMTAMQAAAAIMMRAKGIMTMMRKSLARAAAHACEGGVAPRRLRLPWNLPTPAMRGWLPLLLLLLLLLMWMHRHQHTTTIDDWRPGPSHAVFAPLWLY